MTGYNKTSTYRSKCTDKSRRAVLNVYSDAISANYKTLIEKAGKAEVAGIVKADSYGIGVKIVVPLLLEQGCKTWFVATPEEALCLREIVPEKNTIAVLGGVPFGKEVEFEENSITPVLNSIEDIERWSVNSSSQAIIHFDTGMNRLGLGPDETEKLLCSRDLINRINIFAIMSHFACADEKSHPLTARQFELFSEVAGHFPDSKKSLANSSGLFSNEDYIFDMVRPGYALYGGNPVPWEKNPMKPVVSLKVPVLQIRAARKGETTGYGANYKFDEDRLLATVAIGYADGFHRNFGCAKMFWEGYPCPVLGRISMDLTVVDLSDVFGEKPIKDDYLTLLGDEQGIDDLAKDGNTIGYEILTSLGNRFERRYI